MAYLLDDRFGQGLTHPGQKESIELEERPPRRMISISLGQGREAEISRQPWRLMAMTLGRLSRLVTLPF
jgi:hypothetical protein